MTSGKVLFRWFKVKIMAIELENLLTNSKGNVRAQVESKVKRFGEI